MEFSARQKNGLFLAFLLASPWLLCQAWIAVEAPNKAFESMPSCEPTASNCAHLGENDVYRMNENTSVIINQPVEQVWQKALDYVDDSGTTILYQTGNDSNGHYIHFVEKTIFWRIPDDVFIAVVPVSEQSCTIELHSQSRIGQADFNVNPNRLDGIYSALAEGSS